MSFIEFFYVVFLWLLWLILLRIYWLVSGVSRMFGIIVEVSLSDLFFFGDERVFYNFVIIG